MPLVVQVLIDLETPERISAARCGRSGGGIEDCRAREHAKI